MSVDFYSCDCCRESIYSEYVGSCNKCYQSLCTSCLTNDDVNDNYAYSYGYKFDSSKPELMKQYEKEGYRIYNEDGSHIYEQDDILDDSNIDSKYCPFCNKEAVSSEMIIDYMLDKHKTTREIIEEEIKNNKGV